MLPPVLAPSRPAMAENVMHFARMLRRAGVPVGPAEVLAAADALTRVDIGSRAEVRAALRTALIHRREHSELFDGAFALFWRDPNAARQAAAMALLEDTPPEPAKPRPGSRRLAEAMAPPSTRPPAAPDEPPRIDAVMTASEREQLNAMDFEAMSAEQIRAAKAAMSRLTLPLDERRTRRWRPNAAGSRIDARATLRDSLRAGGELLEFKRASRVVRPPPLVVLCDISGSMARYAQVLLHFIHAVANDRDRVSVFLFGTRLSNVTRQLRQRDPEVAFEMVAGVVPDWSGGTRIGESIEDFNRHWARRVLGQGAVVLLVSDGLDRGEPDGLADAMDRLHRSARRVVWLNPLLRFAGFQPRSQGIRAMLPHVDEFRPVHNLNSLRDLVLTLSRPAPPRREERFAS